MCGGGKQSYRERGYKPRQAQELWDASLMNKTRKQKPKDEPNPNGELCTRCHTPVRTDARISRCSDGCILNGINRDVGRDGIGFISDLIRF